MDCNLLKAMLGRSLYLCRVQMSSKCSFFFSLFVFFVFVFLSLPHSFDSVPLPIIKGPVDSNISGAAAQVIAETIKVTKDFMFVE